MVVPAWESFAGRRVAGDVPAGEARRIAWETRVREALAHHTHEGAAALLGVSRRTIARWSVELRGRVRLARDVIAGEGGAAEGGPEGARR